MARINDLEFQVLKLADEDNEFRSELLADPKAAIEKKIGVPVPESFNIHVHEESEVNIHLVLPPASRELSDSQIRAAAGGGSDGWW